MLQPNTTQILDEVAAVVQGGGTVIPIDVSLDDVHDLA